MCAEVSLLLKRLQSSTLRFVKGRQGEQHTERHVALDGPKHCRLGLLASAIEESRRGEFNLFILTMP